MEPLRFDGADVPVATAGSGQEFDALTAAASHEPSIPEIAEPYPERVASKFYSDNQRLN